MKASSLLIAAMAVAFVGGISLPAAAEEAKPAEVYEIIKAEANRVWRLNKQTGEIAVCTLAGEALACKVATEAPSPPPRSQAEIEADRKSALSRSQAEREADMARDLAFLDRVLESLKSMIRAAMEREQETPNP